VPALEVRIIRAIALALALCACAGACSPVRTLDVFGDRLFVDAIVNDVAVSALLDSAAEISVADRSWAEANSLATFGAATVKGTGGKAEASFVENVSIETLGVTASGLTIAVLDLSDISKRIVGRKVSFILGRELFDQERLAIDIENGSIAAVSRGRRPKGVMLALTAEREIETFKARVNGVDVAAEFDLGNGGAVLIAKATAEKLSLLENTAALKTRKGGGVGGEVDRKIVVLEALEFAGETFTNIEAEVDETENAGELNVGVKLLRAFRMTTDFGERSIWFERRR
jgi:hypothetical protein